MWLRDLGKFGTIRAQTYWVAVLIITWVKINVFTSIFRRDLKEEAKICFNHESMNPFFFKPSNSYFLFPFFSYGYCLFFNKTAQFWTVAVLKYFNITFFRFIKFRLINFKSSNKFDMSLFVTNTKLPVINGHVCFIGTRKAL